MDRTAVTGCPGCDSDARWLGQLKALAWFGCPGCGRVFYAEDLSVPEPGATRGRVFKSKARTGKPRGPYTTRKKLKGPAAASVSPCEGSD